MVLFPSSSFYLPLQLTLRDDLMSLIKAQGGTIVSTITANCILLDDPERIINVGRQVSSDYIFDSIAQEKVVDLKLYQFPIERDLENGHAGGHSDDEDMNFYGASQGPATQMQDSQETESETNESVKPQPLKLLRVVSVPVEETSRKSRTRSSPPRFTFRKRTPSPIKKSTPSSKKRTPSPIKKSGTKKRTPSPKKQSTPSSKKKNLRRPFSMEDQAQMLNFLKVTAPKIKNKRISIFIIQIIAPKKGHPLH